MSRKFLLGVLLTGIITGIGAGLLASLIHIIELWAYGHVESSSNLMTDHTSPQQRWLALAVGGALVSLGWFFLLRRRDAVMPIKDLANGGRPAPLNNLTHSLLQIIAVACGASLGREVAPREVGALAGAQLARYFQLSPEEWRLLTYCGAGAGLAGVYNIPLVGALFTLELLLQRWDRQAICCALITSALATVCARFAVEREPFYMVMTIGGDWNNTLAALLAGLLVAWPAQIFRRGVNWAEQNRCRGRPQLFFLPLAFLYTALLATSLHHIMGNGRTVAQYAFAGLGWWLALALLFAKASATLLTLRAGGYGGVLTPAIALGSLLGLLIAPPLQALLPMLDLTPITLGATAGFLSISMNAPLTALTIVFGLTGQNSEGLLPLIAAVAGAQAVNLHNQRL